MTAADERLTEAGPLKSEIRTVRDAVMAFENGVSTVWWDPAGELECAEDACAAAAHLRDAAESLRHVASQWAREAEGRALDAAPCTDHGIADCPDCTFR